MKKTAKLLLTIGLILFILGAFFSLSVSDVVRLNETLENVEAGEYVTTAKNTEVEHKNNLLIPVTEVPEDAPKQTDATAQWSSDGLTVVENNDTEYFVTTYEHFASVAGKFDTDKYGAFKVLTVDGTEYYTGTVTESAILWDDLDAWDHMLLTLNLIFLPLMYVGIALTVVGYVMGLVCGAAEAGVPFKSYLWQKFGPARIWSLIKNNAIVVGIILLAVIVSILRPNFISEANFRNLLSNTAIRFIIAVGVSGCLITKGTDLSAGRVTGFAACLSAILLQRAGDYSNKFYPSIGNLPIIPVLLFVLAICALIGGINGTIIAYLKVPPFIATLGMQTLVYGICLVYTGAQPIGTLQSAYTGIALGYIGNRIFSYIAIIALVVGILMWFLYNKMRHGKYMYALGGNESAAEVAGINTSATKIRIYMLAAVLYGLTGFLMAAKSGGASVNTASGYELEAIAGCTIGGVSVNGGVGRISGILIGVLVFELLKIALQFLGVESSYTYIAQGLVIIIAVALDLRKYLAKK